MFGIKKLKDGIVIQVRVKPKSPKFSIELNDQIVIHCKSPPQQNKANLEIIKELKKSLNKEVEIISGLKSKKKSILIHNIKEEELMKWVHKT